MTRWGPVRAIFAGAAMGAALWGGLYALILLGMMLE